MGDDGKWFLNQTDPTNPYYDWEYGTKGEWSQGEPWCEKPEQPDDVNTVQGIPRYFPLFPLIFCRKILLLLILWTMA